MKNSEEILIPVMHKNTNVCTTLFKHLFCKVKAEYFIILPSRRVSYSVFIVFWNGCCN